VAGLIWGLRTWKPAQVEKELVVHIDAFSAKEAH
jgi:hypothetical protein